MEEAETRVEKTNGKFPSDAGGKVPTGQNGSLGRESSSPGTLELADKGKQVETTPGNKGTISLLHRQDVWAWVGGVVFILALSGAIWGIGLARGWDANSGYSHNSSATSSQRFWPEPYTPEPGVKGRDGSEADSRWYYWKLPPDQVTAGTRAFVWLAYVCHQTLVWAVTYIHQQKMSHLSKEERYSVSLSKWNWIALALNGLFHLLHLLQTHTTYDALAQDVSIASSQGSVIMLLVFIVLMEYKRRGLLFGWPTEEHTGIVSRKLRLNYDPIDVIRRYHGYAFSWAAVYTFWYHPMENTWGHVLGFAHTWMIMLQGSLAFTRMHVDAWWRLLLEAWVTLHGAVVAFQTGGPDQMGTKLWPMFLFGFAFVLCFTQVYSLPFWRAIHWGWRAIPPVVYLAVTLYCYSWIPDAQGKTWVRLQEIIRIPAVYYLFFFLAYFLLFLLLKLEGKIRGEGTTVSPVTVRKQVLFLTIVVFIFAAFVGLSAAVQFGDLQTGLIVLMIYFVGVFVVFVCVIAMLLRQLFLGHGKVQDSVPLNGVPTSGTAGNEMADDPKKS